MHHSRFHNIKLIFFAVLFAVSLSVQAQPASSIIAGVDSSGSQIIVKWFSEQVVFPLGVHVYRSEAGGSWVRLTAPPLKRGGIPVPQAAVQGDSTMQAFIEAAQTATVGDMQGVIGAMMMVKAVQSNHYARFLGLCYIDGDVTPGVSYRYRVAQVQPGGETPVGETGSVVAGRYEPVAPPEGLAAEAGDTEAAIRWTPEPERFFGVNVYRRSNRDTVTVRVNSDMILISAQAGADGKQKYPDVFFTDKNLNNSYRYTYYLRSIDYLGREGLPSAPVTIAPHDMT
ncbi:MAG: hypothetical protein LBV26_01365, partial [Bacteroidales bacterium]|nr:hypothetical protein [Bacteroidales bacterium]